MLRKPSEYLPAALAGLRRRLMPDSTLLLRHDGHSSAVTRVGSPARGEEAIADGEVAEGIRVLATAADFPRLSRGSLVELSGAPRIVTSARSDPALATLSIGLSASLEKCRAAFRRPGTKTAQPVDVLAVEGETVDPASDAFAPTFQRLWHVAISVDGWYEPTEPQVGDSLELSPQDVSLRVASVDRRDGYFVLTCRARR
ncbi:MAG: hypothetical protein J6V72_11030 [Kiritimatiellae bacterium]|nr:hypothetical protein [Kiritimatiellia bacterium]